MRSGRLRKWRAPCSDPMCRRTISSPKHFNKPCLCRKQIILIALKESNCRLPGGICRPPSYGSLQSAILSRKIFCGCTEFDKWENLFGVHILVATPLTKIFELHFDIFILGFFSRLKAQNSVLKLCCKLSISHEPERQLVSIFIRKLFFQLVKRCCKLFYSFFQI